VIGKTVPRHTKEVDALQYVFGYSCFNDMSVRDYQKRTPQWTIGKNFDRTGGFGPHLVTADELAPGATGLRIRSLLNGQVMQDANTSDMIFSVAETIALLADVLTLEPGDVIVMGTPAGVGQARNPPVWMKAGDLESRSQVGTLTNSLPTRAHERKCSTSPSSAMDRRRRGAGLLGSGVQVYVANDWPMSTRSRVPFARPRSCACSSSLACSSDRPCRAFTPGVPASTAADPPYTMVEPSTRRATPSVFSSRWWSAPCAPRGAARRAVTRSCQRPRAGPDGVTLASPAASEAGARNTRLPATAVPARCARGSTWLEDLDFDEPWLVVECGSTKVASPSCRKSVCSIASRSGRAPVIGPKTHRRWEISLKPGDPAHAATAPHLKLCRLADPGRRTGPGQLRFHALWRPTGARPVFLAGAAHMQPPRAGHVPWRARCTNLGGNSRRAARRRARRRPTLLDSLPSARRMFANAASRPSVPSSANAMSRRARDAGRSPSAAAW
jgi:hypothetical protein